MSVRSLFRWTRGAEAGRLMSEMLQNITESLDIGIVTCDSNYRLRFWNSLGPKLFGAPPEMFTRGRPIQEIFSFFAERGDYGPGRAQRLAVEMPICQEVYRVMHEGKPVRAAARALMGREVRSETE